MLRTIKLSERRVHPANDDHKDSITPLPQPGQQPPLHLARGVIRCVAGHFRLRKQLWDCSQLHLPYRWVHFTSQMEGGDGGNDTIEQQSSSNRCDSRRHAQ